MTEAEDVQPIILTGPTPVDRGIAHVTSVSFDSNGFDYEVEARSDRWVGHQLHEIRINVMVDRSKPQPQLGDRIEWALYATAERPR